MIEALFDNCTPRLLRGEFGEGIKVTEARAVGLAEISNSELERKAYDLGYDALITVDTDLGKPEHIPKYHLPVVLLRAFPSAVPDTLSVLIPKAEEVLLSDPETGLYIWDNYKNKILSARSLDENEKQREKLRKAEKAAEAAKAARAASGRFP